MTVQELIDELNKIEDKTLPVIVYDDLDFCDNLNWQEAEYIFESSEYFYKNGKSQEWDCVKISGN